MNMQKAPIAIFAYNRKDNLEKMMASLQACHGFAESHVFLFIDGPKGEKDRPKVEEVRTFAKSLGWPNLDIIARKANMGLKKSIFTGVSDICARFGRVIVLEDDLILSPVTLDYFNEGLEKYETEPRVWSIAACQYDAPGLRSRTTALALPFPHPWGWATWKRAWDRFDIATPLDPNDLASLSFQKAFDVFGLRDFKEMLLLNTKGLINSWFILWYYTLFSAGGLTIFPPVTLVQNIGQKEGGTHASALNPYRFLVRPSQPASTKPLFPETIKLDYQAIDIIRTCYDARVQKMISFLGRIKRRLKKALSS